MRTKAIMTICLFLLMVGKASAQWAVIDPTNIAQSIINSSNNIVHTSSTAANMVKNFQETVKIYEQGKKYYDALKSVNNLVKDARKVQQTILMVGDITDIYVSNYQKMLQNDIEAMQSDPNFSIEASNGVYIVFLIIGIVGYFTIPTVAGWIIQAGGIGNYNRNVNTVGSLGGSIAGATAGNVAGRAGRLIKSGFKKR